ncbi:MAG TPA: YchJ family protein [Rectinemataceae bacterium]|nr:YchJ family protein [Rectinemataceae bacterium]
MDNCPCGSGREYESCCGPYVSKRALAPTAEALMRSRYSAYARHQIDFIVDTCVRDEEHGIDLEATKRWSEKSEWLGLKIIRTEKGGPGDDKGLVEFSATYVLDGLREEHHEVSSFVKREGAWLYEEGEMITETVVRAAPKVGRNDPCPCGSGKKYKKCCGAAA